MGALTSICGRWGWGHSPPVYLLFDVVYWSRQPGVFLYLSSLLSPLTCSLILWDLISQYTLRFNQVEKGVYWFHLVHLSVCGWRLFVMNSLANIHVTIDCSTVLPLVLGVVTRQKPQINGSVVLGADESPWPCGTVGTLHTLEWFWVSRKIFVYSHHNTIVFFSKMSVCGQNRVHSVSSTILVGSMSYLHILSSNFRRCVVCKVCYKIKKFEILVNSLNL